MGGGFRGGAIGGGFRGAAIGGGGFRGAANGPGFRGGFGGGGLRTAAIGTGFRGGIVERRLRSRGYRWPWLPWPSSCVAGFRGGGFRRGWGGWGWGLPLAGVGLGLGYYGYSILLLRSVRRLGRPHLGRRLLLRRLAIHSTRHDPSVHPGEHGTPSPKRS